MTSGDLQGFFEPRRDRDCVQGLGLPARFVTKLLEDLVFFVCVVPNNGQDVLSVVTANPNRERQKLMREQNILAQVRTRKHSALSVISGFEVLIRTEGVCISGSWLFHVAVTVSCRFESFSQSEFVTRAESSQPTTCSTAEDQSRRSVSPDLRHPQGSVL